MNVPLCRTQLADPLNFPHKTASTGNTSPNDRDAVYLGIDVGGTSVKLGLVDAAGHLFSQTATSTTSLQTPERVFAFAIQFARDELAAIATTADRKSLRGVGLAVPGVLDTSAMRLREVVNLPGWLDRPLLELLTHASGLPSMVVNDANAAALAEHSLRRLGSKSLALLTLGTGIGCGIVIEGNPHSGDHGCAGEIGHITIDFDSGAWPCPCGSRGHLETYAGSGGVIARLRAAYAAEPSAEMPACLANSDVTPKQIAEHAADGNLVCQHVIDETALYLGRAIGLLGQVIDPAVVLLGGAMTFGGPGTVTGTRFLEHVRQTVRDTTLAQVGQNVVIEFASLGNDAGVLGAAEVARQTAADAVNPPTLE